jgi:hypothetical protein
LIYRKIPPSKFIVDEKITLKIINTTLKPRIKLTVLAIGLGVFSVFPVKGEPPIMHRYDGISGSTQGDKKDSTPAPKAMNIDRFSDI